MLVIFVTTAFLAFTQFVVGWGAGVHPVIGHLAELYLLPDTVRPLYITAQTIAKRCRRNSRR
jgi:hypothetical protein